MCEFDHLIKYFRGGANDLSLLATISKNFCCSSKCMLHAIIPSPSLPPKMTKQLNENINKALINII